MDCSRKHRFQPSQQWEESIGYMFANSCLQSNEHTCVCKSPPSPFFPLGNVYKLWDLESRASGGLCQAAQFLMMQIRLNCLAWQIQMKHLNKYLTMKSAINGTTGMVINSKNWDRSTTQAILFISSEPIKTWPVAKSHYEKEPIGKWLTSKSEVRLNQMLGLCPDRENNFSESLNGVYNTIKYTAKHHV